jgi:hypothetical protein
VNEARLQRLYWIAGVLLAIRFGLLPWVDWQTERRDALQVLTKRLDRSVGVIENRSAIEKSAKDLNASLVTYRANFRQSDSVEAFKLAAQQEISGVIGQAGLRVTLFDWVVDKFDDAPPLARVRARIQLAGTVQALAGVQGRLEAQFPAFVIREVRVDTPNATNTPSTTQGTMTLVADVYFRQVSGGAP